MDKWLFNRQGKPITLEIWSELNQDWNYKVVKKTTTNGFRVSTIWLGMNHQWRDNEEPLIFETMVFPDDDSYDDLFCERYATLEQAEEGHERIVDSIIAGEFKGYENG